MRSPLRSKMLVCLWLLAGCVLLTGSSALRGVGGAQEELARFRSGVETRIAAERVALAVHRTLRALERAVDTGDRAGLDEPREALGRAIGSLRASSGGRSELAAPPGSGLKDFDRYVSRVLELARNGRREEALNLVRDDVSVLASHRFLEPLDAELDAFDEGAIRSLDRALAGARHWSLASSLGQSERNRILAQNVEAILVWRTLRQAAAALRGEEELDAVSQSWQRIERIARASTADRGTDPDLASHFSAWLASMKAAREDSGELALAWRRFDTSLVPAAERRAAALRDRIEDSLGGLEAGLSRLRLWILSWMLLALGLAVWAPRWISSHLSRPLRAISEWADAVRRGDPSAALPESSPDEIGVAVQSLREMASAFADLTRKAKMLTFYDSVTGLPNRHLLQERLQNSLVWAQLNHRMVGLLTVSLSSFKQINDAHGHDVGDRILRETAERLSQVVRLGDLATRPGSDKALAHLARLGGAEFTLMLSDIADPGDAGSVANRIVSRISEPFAIDGEQLFADPSVGIAVYPIDGVEASQLVAHANVAAHHARLHPTSQYKYYSEAMNAAASRRLAIGSRLRGALEREELSIHLQPIRDAKTGRVSCAEVLLRWIDGELGPIPPSEFIPVAEELSLIGAIGDWVVRTACRQAMAWRERGFAPVRFAVNASPLQLRDEEWADRVSAILAETGTSTDQLEIEITESSIMHDDAITLATLTSLHEMGIGIALDDFGTGYSSLSYLHRFPIDRVKIDRSFVAEIGTDNDGTELTAAMLAMAQSLRLRVVAEGIETHDQADFLCSRGCDELQGYLFGRPVPPEEFERFLVLEKDCDDGDC